MALVARVTRSSVRDELGREHVQTAVSRGIPFRLVLRRHVLRNAAIPITTIAGLTIASLIAISAVVERAFALNGLGAYLVEASLNKDFAVVQGISLVLVAAFVITNTIVDILYALLDPRVTLGSRARERHRRRRGRRQSPPRDPRAARHRLGRPRLRRRDRVRAADRRVRAAHRAVRPELHPASLRLRRPGRRPLRSASTAAAATCSRGCWAARRRRCSARSPSSASRSSSAPCWRSPRPGAAAGSTTPSARLLDILFAFPGILIAIMAAAVFGPGLKTAVIALSIAYTPYIARVLRGAALRERAQPYISALEVQGLAAIAICVRHLVPNIIGRCRRPGHDPVRLRDGRPGGDLVHRPRRAAAAGRLGRDGRRRAAPASLQGYPLRVAVGGRSASSSSSWPSTCSASASPTAPAGRSR